MSPLRNRLRTDGHADPTTPRDALSVFLVPIPRGRSENNVENLKKVLKKNRKRKALTENRFRRLFSRRVSRRSAVRRPTAESGPPHERVPLVVVVREMIARQNQILTPRQYTTYVTEVSGATIVTRRYTRVRHTHIHLLCVQCLNGIFLFCPNL